jgi:SAM-dependent methyltransferase
MSTDYLDVTEVAGEPISAEQLQRLHHRYFWARTFCEGRDVVECACGTGPGLGVLASVAATLEAGDVSEAMVERVRAHYGSRARISRFDAQQLPFPDVSKDVIILFEAIYYLPDAARFVAECRRVLKPGGHVLVATANKDLNDFNPSPYSHRYYGTVELTELFTRPGMHVDLFGYLPTDEISFRQRVLRPIKRAVVGLGLMPRSMKGKQLLKRLVFGRPVVMPAEVSRGAEELAPMTPLDARVADTRHKVIYAVASLA